jgi:ferredoxin
MSESSRNMHYVCTHAEARSLVDQAEGFWVTDCGCRAGRKEGECARSRADVCLTLGAEMPDYVVEEARQRMRRASREDVEGLFALAAEKHLVTRPFREPPAMEATGGVCFCCDDCCAYFPVRDDCSCDRGTQVAMTDAAGCKGCGACTKVCYFGARHVRDGQLTADTERCFGCGLCVDVCPEDAIATASRQAPRDMDPPP